MTTVLIVDDNLSKIEAYRNILCSLGIQSEQIICVSSIIDAKRALSTTCFDVLLLDLVIPRRIDTEPQADGGIELLHELKSLETYKMPNYIFAVSEYDTPIASLHEDSDKFNVTSIKYDRTSEEWKKRLSAYIEQIIRVRNANTDVYDFDVAIVCALHSPELTEVLKLPFGWNEHNELGDSTDYYVGGYKGKRIVCAAAYEMGMPAASILAHKVINIYKPKYLFMTGIAAATKRSSLQFGDIMVADPCFDYGSGKRVFEDGVSKFQPDYRQIRLNDEMCQLIKRLSNQPMLLHEIRESCPYPKPNNVLQIKVGPFASGAAVLADPSAVKDILEHSRKLIGFDMEAYGIMLAGHLATKPKPITVALKSVSDFGDTEKSDDYQQYASFTSAKFLQCILDAL